MNLKDKDAEILLSILRKIRAEANNPERKKYQIENLCSKASLIINKAKRKNGKVSAPKNLRASE